MAHSKRRKTIPWVVWHFSQSQSDRVVVVADKTATNLKLMEIFKELRSVWKEIMPSYLKSLYECRQKRKKLWLRSRVVIPSIEPTSMIYFVSFIEWIFIFSFRRYTFELDIINQSRYLGCWIADDHYQVRYVDHDHEFMITNLARNYWLRIDIFLLQDYEEFGF